MNNLFINQHFNCNSSNYIYWESSVYEQHQEAYIICFWAALLTHRNFWRPFVPHKQRCDPKGCTFECESRMAFKSYSATKGHRKVDRMQHGGAHECSNCYFSPLCECETLGGTVPYKRIIPIERPRSNANDEGNDIAKNLTLGSSKCSSLLRNNSCIATAMKQKLCTPRCVMNNVWKFQTDTIYRFWVLRAHSQSRP